MDQNGQKGALFANVSDPNMAQGMIPFFPLFKIVFKFAQIGMTMKTKINLERKQETMKKEMKDADVQLETQKAYIMNLSFGQRIKAEADRIRQEDIAVLENKRRLLALNIDEHRRKYTHQEDFNRDYFNIQGF